MAGEGEPAVVLGETDIAHKVRRMAFEILEACAHRSPLAFIGIHNRGVTLATRVLEIARKDRDDIHFGTLDISLYRDDYNSNPSAIPTLRGSNLNFDLNGCHVVLFDDVLFTGRTVRAALDAIMDYGRPACIQLAVLVDRENREFPVAATYVGHHLKTTKEDYVKVRLKGPDPDEGVFLIRQPVKTP